MNDVTQGTPEMIAELLAAPVDVVERAFRDATGKRKGSAFVEGDAWWVIDADGHQWLMIEIDGAETWECMTDPEEARELAADLRHEREAKRRRAA